MNIPVSSFELALFAQALLWLIVAGLFLASGQASIFHPLAIYLGFHGMVFVLRPCLVYWLGFDTIWNYMQTQPPEHILVKTLAVSSAGLVVFALASLTVGWTKLGYSMAVPPPFSAPQRRGLIVATLLLAPIVAYSIHSLSSGGMEGTNIGGTFIMTGASGYTIEAQYMAGPLLCAWLAATRFRWMAMVPLSFYVAYRSYNGWNRWTVVLLFLVIALVYAWQKRNRWIPWWTLALAVPLYLLFHTLGQNRDYFKQMSSGEASYATENFLSESEKMKAKYDSQEFANFDYLCYVVNAVPEKTGTYTYGSQYLQLFTEPIPRKLWPGKPIGAPVRSFNLNDYGNFNGLTPSLIGDGWMSGGWVGMILTLGLGGALLGLAHRWFWKHGDENAACLFYLAGLAMLPQWFRDGGISISKFLFWNLLPLLVWLAFSWSLGRKLVPGYSVVLPQGCRLRIVASDENGGLAP